LFTYNIETQDIVCYI